MSATTYITLQIDVDKNGKAKIREAEKDVDQAFDRIKRGGMAASSIMSQLGVAIGGAVAAYKLLNMAKEGWADASREETAGRRLEAVIRATGGAAGYTAEEMKVMAGEMQKAFSIGDEEIMEQQAILATFRNISGETFREAIGLIQDMAFVMQTDGKSGAIQLGKALNDPKEGITALTRVGVSFTEQQKDQIKAFQETNDLAAAQGVILNELRGEFGGAASSMQGTATKAVRDLSLAWGDLKQAMAETVSQSPEIILAIDDITKSLREWIEIISGEKGLGHALSNLYFDFKGGLGMIGAMVTYTKELFSDAVSADEALAHYQTRLQELLEAREAALAPPPAPRKKEYIDIHATEANREPWSGTVIDTETFGRDMDTVSLNLTAGLTNLDESWAAHRAGVEAGMGELYQNVMGEAKDYYATLDEMEIASWEDRYTAATNFYDAVEARMHMWADEHANTWQQAADIVADATQASLEAVGTSTAQMLVYHKSFSKTSEALFKQLMATVIAESTKTTIIAIANAIKQAVAEQAASAAIVTAKATEASAKSGASAAGGGPWAVAAAMAATLAVFVAAIAAAKAAFGGGGHDEPPPRAHSGWNLRPDEVPIIAQTGERIISRTGNERLERLLDDHESGTLVGPKVIQIQMGRRMLKEVLIDMQRAGDLTTGTVRF